MELKPLPRLTSALRIMLKTNIAITAMAVIIGFYEYYTYANLPSGTNIEETLLSSDIYRGIVGLTQLVVFIVLGIFFLRWIHRINKNLRALSGEEMEFTPGWSVGWYFIPFFNLVRPYQVMKEIWNVSHKNQDNNYTLLGWWWFLWIFAHALARIAVKFEDRAVDVSEYARAAVLYIASDGLDVGLSVVALLLVSRIGAAYSKNIIEPPVTPDGKLYEPPSSTPT